MSLASAMVARYFESGNVAVGLARQGNEVRGGGYQRIRRPGWESRGQVASVLVEWGPFSEDVEFDEAVLFDGDNIVERYSIGFWRIPAGGTHRTELFIELG